MSYDAWLVEEAVCRAANDLPVEQQRLFRRERDRIYELRDERKREAEFQRLHWAWFARLRLGDPVEHALAAHSDVAAGVRLCQVAPAASMKEELADLRFAASAGLLEDDETSDRSQLPVLLLRLRPESFLDPNRVLALLRHELLHVADMLDPAFGYQKVLPSSEEGPAYDNILRNRYRVIWDTTIDGRLARRGQIGPHARDARRAEFARAFPGLGSSVEEVFGRWFDGPRATHQEILAFALAPCPQAGSGSHSPDGRCPICRFPVAALDPHPERLSPMTRRAIQLRHPSWLLEHGLCSQCADLYESRSQAS